MISIKRMVASSCVAAAMSVGVGVAAVPVQAAPLFTGGLVNITITDVANNVLRTVNVQVPIGVAANVCGLTVNALAQAASTGPVSCTSATTANLPVAFRP